MEILIFEILDSLNFCGPVSTNFIASIGLLIFPCSFVVIHKANTCFGMNFLKGQIFGSVNFVMNAFTSKPTLASSFYCSKCFSEQFCDINPIVTDNFS